ncbi:MAG: 4-(cytidine 5'-diphospho)-2-C-methyl-D-erythritol kinase [Phycisphaerae bacterium]|nr:4-(cytidine 5'-diphospho)-2-C-methyl-D-erythritol kinase [Phycisphaerae bacterium]
MLTPAIHNTGSPGKNKGVSLSPPAKINLSLVVFQRRNDGFHALHTVMGAIDFCDELDIHLSDREGIALSCSGIPSPSGRDNLVYQAASLLGETAGISPSLAISLHKNIPSGAGLGGASSDAAACLIGLNALWSLDLSVGDLTTLAGRLGSDVPFFINGPIAQCTGRGEIITALPHRTQQSILLIDPAIHVSTPHVFKHYTPDHQVNEDYMKRVHYYLKLGDLDGLLSQGLNTLTSVTMGLFPALRLIQEKIEHLGIGPVHMSGSGSSLYVASDSHHQLDQWAQQINEQKLACARVVCFKNENHLFQEVKHASL